MEVLEKVGGYQVGSVRFSAKGNRVLILQDAFKSGYECEACAGSGKAKCGECDGKAITARGHKCSHCNAGEVRCEACDGKGGLLVAPETSQRRPTTGQIVSAGPDCKELKVGDSVMFSNYAGYVIDLTQAGLPIALRVLHENEILCAIEGKLELRNFKGNTDIANYTP